MIKFLLSTSISVFLLTTFSFGQACQPDAQYTKTGVHPDSATGFDTAYVGIPYTQLVTIVIPKDTAAFPFPVPPLPWDSTVLESVTGLPGSMSHACWNNSSKPNRCSWKKNSKGCAIITGTPVASEIGTHALVFNTNNYVGGQTSPNAYVIDYYKIVVMPSPTTEVNENSGIQTLLQNNPNPFDERSEILFTAEDNGTAKFKIYNLIGTVIQQYDIKVKKGTNRIELNGKNFDSGVYFYSIMNGSSIFTLKMIVKK